MSTAVILALSADKVNANIRTDGIQKGVFFKAPEETDAANHSLLKNNNDVVGSEIYLNWGDVEKTEGEYDWSVFDKRAAEYRALGKTITASIVSTSFGINDAPEWLFTKYDLRRISKGYWLNFEKGDKNYSITGKYLKGPAAIAGYNSLSGSSSGIENIIVKSNTSSQPLSSTYGYSIQFDYKVISNATFFIRAVSARGGANATKYIEWNENIGASGSKTFEFSVGLFPDYSVEFGIKNGEYIIDNINIIEKKPGFFVGNLTFPNYFDPLFKVKYENFVKAFATKYKDDTTVKMIYVGGFGRWDEITLGSDSDQNSLEDQWTSFGYTDIKYIDHIRWCIDTYKKYFGNKELMISCVGYPGTDTFRNQWLIDWKVGGYAAQKGVAIKYNGWQTKCTEWNTQGNAIFTLYQRYKNDPNVRTIIEEGLQINNYVGSEIMGNPISLFNRAISFGIDNYWIYPNDITDPYVSRYLHYLNEQAGSGLITKHYNISNLYNYTSPYSRETYKHYDILMGLFNSNSSSLTHTTVDGVKVTKTNYASSEILYSLDDRLKYNGMYGSVISIDYFDAGTDTFDVYGRTSGGKTKIGSVRKTNTNKWKTYSIYNTSCTNSNKNGIADEGLLDYEKATGSQDTSELIINDNGDGFEVIRNIEINYVPANEWQENQIASVESDGGTKEITSSNYTFEIPVGKGQILSSISLPVGYKDDYKFVNLRAVVEAKIGGSYTALTTKDFFMPEKDDWFTIPLASKPIVDGLRVTLITTSVPSYYLAPGNPLGNGLIKTKNGTPAYRLYSYIANTNETGRIETGVLYAMYPFFGLELNSNQVKAGDIIRIKKLISSGGEYQISDAVVINNAGKLMCAFEPQVSGRYYITLSNGVQLNTVTPLYLNRMQGANLPKRQLIGKTDPQFASSGGDIWKAISGFENIRVEKNILKADTFEENPTLETSKPISINATYDHYLHFVMKNETSSAFVKLIYKTAKRDYCEEQAILIPVVSNDSQFREYSFPIGLGYETTWSGVITGLRFLPVTAHTDTGHIQLALLELTKGNNKYSVFNEILDIEKLGSDLNISPENNIVKPKIETSSNSNISKEPSKSSSIESSKPISSQEATSIANGIISTGEKISINISGGYFTILKGITAGVLKSEIKLSNGYSIKIVDKDSKIIEKNDALIDSSMRIILLKDNVEFKTFSIKLVNTINEVKKNGDLKKYLDSNKTKIPLVFPIILALCGLFAGSFFGFRKFFAYKRDK